MYNLYVAIGLSHLQLISLSLVFYYNQEVYMYGGFFRAVSDNWALWYLWLSVLDLFGGGY